MTEPSSLGETMKPHEQVAFWFMERKGYKNAKPVDIEALDDGTPCWYFLYELEEGDLELEVFWDKDKQEWETTVTTFTLVE